MDFDRAIAKCLFYGISPDDVFEAVRSFEYEDTDCRKWMKTELGRLLSYDLSSFTSRELDKLVELELQKYSKRDVWAYPLHKTKNLANELLDVEQDLLPKVKQEHALRWCETVRYIGEDLFACAKVASSHDATKQPTWLWKSPLPLEPKLTHQAVDIHFHVSSSYDAFDIAWIMWMNHKDAGLTKWHDVAAIIRYALFRVLIREDEQAREDLKGIFHRNQLFRDQVNTVYEEVNDILSPSINQENEKRWDYALSSLTLTRDMYSSPYVLLCGEKRLHELFFRQLITKKNNETTNVLCPYFYLYHVVKNYLRKDAILNNGLVGLKNFQMLKKGQNLASVQVVCERYALMTANDDETSVEARVGYGSINGSKLDEGELFCQSIKERMLYPLNLPLLRQPNSLPISSKQESVETTYVLSISKTDITTKEKLLKDMGGIKNLLHLYLSNFYQNTTLDIACVGVDFAGSDTKCHPFVFQNIVKFIRDAGCDNLTYHAGEDFYDLMDGIRTIDEVLNFLEWNKNNRLGHCLSLFTDVDDYYQSRHLNMVMPQGMLLDNLVWLMHAAKEQNVDLKPETEVYIEKKIKNLYRSIYGRVTGNDFYQLLFTNPGDFSSKRYDSTVLGRYNKNVVWQMPKDPTILQVLKEKQRMLCERLHTEGIHIETCPTSNMLIGFFERYDQTPSAQLIGNSMSASINTDIKGSVGTSLSNEYAIVRRALLKSGKTEAEVDAYLKKMADESIGHRFPVKKAWF